MSESNNIPLAMRATIPPTKIVVAFTGSNQGRALPC